ncbi:MAG TPA: hypothetical protein VH851_10350 [Candidatus Binatia bacterium]
MTDEGAITGASVLFDSTFAPYLLGCHTPVRGETMMQRETLKESPHFLIGVDNLGRGSEDALQDFLLPPGQT